MEPLKAPYIVEIDKAASPDPGRAPEIEAGAEILLPPRRTSALARLAAWVFGLLAGLVLSVWAWNFVLGLWAVPGLGVFALGLILAAAAILVVWALGEVLAWSRLAKAETLRGAVIAAGDLAAARAVVERLVALGPKDAMPRAEEVFDADGLLALAERRLMAPRDAEARAVIEASARQVAMVTALVPLALADVATALVVNLRMLRRLAEIYGGRAGSFGALRLAGRVAAALTAAGALALSDDLISSLAGGGLVSKLSRRFGEGVVNGALTARVGLAAMELCRPMPFAVLPKPSVAETLRRALTGLFG
jgi:putative membrane protein